MHSNNGDTSLTVQIKPLRFGAIEGLIDNRSHPDPPPFMIDEDSQPMYEVADIIDSRIYRNQLQYLIHWKGYADCDRTWEPAKVLVMTSTPALLDRVRSFHHEFPGKPGPLLERDIMS